MSKNKNYDDSEYAMAWDTHLLSLNSNILCVVDMVTTGPKAGYDNLLEICVYPLNSDLKQYKKILPFTMILSPKRPENIDLERLDKYMLNRHRLYEMVQKGTDAYVAADRFDSWFEKIRLREGKKLSILSYDWPNKKSFLEDWLGELTYQRYFDYRYRDLLPVSLFCNDCAEFKVEQIPYPKQNLAHLMSQTHTEHEKRMNDPLLNCVAIAECYKRMIFTRPVYLG